MNKENAPFIWETNAGVITKYAYLSAQAKYDKMNKIVIHIPKVNGKKISVYI